MFSHLKYRPVGLLQSGIADDRVQRRAEEEHLLLEALLLPQVPPVHAGDEVAQGLLFILQKLRQHDAHRRVGTERLEVRYKRALPSKRATANKVTVNTVKDGPGKAGLLLVQHRRETVSLMPHGEQRRKVFRQLLQGIHAERFSDEIAHAADMTGIGQILHFQPADLFDGLIAVHLFAPAGFAAYQLKGNGHDLRFAVFLRTPCPDPFQHRLEHLQVVRSHRGDGRLVVSALQYAVEAGHPHLRRYLYVSLRQVDAHSNRHRVIGADEDLRHRSSGVKILVQRAHRRLVPKITVYDPFRWKRAAVRLQYAAAQVDALLGIGVSLDSRNHDDFPASMVFHDMPGHLLKSFPVRQGEIDTALVLPLQHEHGKPFAVGKLDQVRVDVIRANHLAEQQEARQLWNLKNRQELLYALLPARFDAAAVKGNAHRQIVCILRRSDQMIQHEIQVFHILPGRAYGYDLSFLALHLLRTSFRGAVLFSMNRLSFTDIITQYRDNYNNEGLEYRRSRYSSESRYDGAILS